MSGEDQQNHDLWSMLIFAGHDTPPPKSNMTMENPPFEDVFPIENGDFPMSCYFSGVYSFSNMTFI